MKLLAAIKKEEINGSPKNFVSALNKVGVITKYLIIQNYDIQGFVKFLLLILDTS